MRKVGITIGINELEVSVTMTRLLSHSEYQTFKELAKGQKFDIKPKGHDGVEVTAPIALWEELGY